MTDPIMFSDSIHVINYSDGGLVIEFQQKLPDNHYSTVSRIGITTAHAKKFINLLSKEVSRKVPKEQS